MSIIAMALLSASFCAEEPVISAGVAQVDITPDYPVRLSGFGGRRTESEGITARIWAKALALHTGKDGPAVLITTDNLCVSDEITQEIASRLASKAGLKREQLTITATHTHTAPMLNKVCPTLFGVPIPDEHQQHIHRYTEEFKNHLEAVALAAMKDLRPSRLSYGIGTAGFAANRRTQGGPVDHDLPVLVVRDLHGSVRALYFSYACHCVTLSDNKISGDWAGFAQEAVAKLFPGAVALASVGCGADSNPDSGVTGTNVVVCAKQGQQIADEIKRLTSAELAPITALPSLRYERIDLALDTPRTRAEWEGRARKADAIGHHARVNLARLDRGESLPTTINYPVQSWVFGNQLAIVFLPGETVVDYALRLKGEFDRRRIWVNGYSNDGRCYIPSERILKEGGYEGGDAMIYYDMPQRFAPGLEQKIIDAVHRQLPHGFRSARGSERTAPLASVSSPTPERTTHTFLATGAETRIVSGDGQVVWRFALPTRDGWVLPSGHLLLAVSKCDSFPKGGIVELTRSGETLFQWQGTQSEVNTVQALPRQRYLVTEAGPEPRVLEIDRQGQILVQVPIPCQLTNFHMQTRMTRKLSNGNYLVPHLLDKVVREYTPEGKIAWEAATPNWAFTAIRLPNGNTLVGCTYGNEVVELDPQGKIAWRLTNDDLPGRPLRDACGVQRLPNGNTVVTSYGAKAGEPRLTEVTLEKRIVWTYTDDRPSGIHEFQILDTSGQAHEDEVWR